MTIRSSVSRLALASALLGSLAIATPAFAQDMQNDSSQSDAAQSSSTTSTTTHHHHKGKMNHGGDMKQRVEERISSLHAKLKITQDQESAWGTVAQAMRDNEEQISGLIKDRHEDTSKNALDDMSSYQKIAQAHADGIAKVLTAFTPLYNSMSDDQKANADQIFGHFEGRPHGKWHHAKHGAMAPSSTSGSTTPAPVTSGSGSSSGDMNSGNQ